MLKDLYMINTGLFKLDLTGQVKLALSFLYCWAQSSNRGSPNMSRGKAPQTLVIRRPIKTHFTVSLDIVVPSERIDKKNYPNSFCMGRGDVPLKEPRLYPTILLGSKESTTKSDRS